MVVWAVVQSQIAGRPYVSANTPAYLIQGLDPDQIAGINITSSDGDQVVLTRRGSSFFVADKDNYPAPAGEINKLIKTCLDIKTNELCTDNPANHKDLGATEENARVVVKFLKADSSLLTGVVIGKPKGQGSYVRQVSDNRVYLTTAQIPWIKKRGIDFVEQLLTDVKREDINSVTVSYPDETYVLRPADDGKTVVLEILPEEKSLKNDAAEKVFTALANLKFEDVNAESSWQLRHAEVKFDKRYICRLKDSTAYTFWLAKDDDKWFARCDAQFADKTPITKTQGEVESQELLKAKETKLIARDAAEEFTDDHKGWVYQIPDYRAENLTKPLADLLETAGEDVNTKPAEVNELLGTVDE
jgi:hypothetical protein